MKKLTAILLVAVLLCTAMTVTTYADDTEDWMKKIDPELLSRMEKPGENIGVWMWFIDIDREEFANRVAEATGYTEAEYEAKKNSMPQTTAQEKQALNAFINSYRSTRNRIMDEMYKAHNSAILESLGLTDIRFLSTGTNSSIVNVPKSRIYEITQSGDVTYLYYHPLEVELPDPPEGVEYRFGDKLVRYLSSLDDNPMHAPTVYCCEELCDHRDEQNETDWAIVFAINDAAAPWYGMAIIGNRVIVSGTYPYFEFGMALYDAKEDTFYDLSKMTDYSAYPGLSKALDTYGKGKLLGDLDGDDAITSVDVTILRRCEANMTEYPDSDWIDESDLVNDFFKPINYYSDFNRDGERNVIDATCVQRYLANQPYPKYR